MTSYLWIAVSCFTIAACTVQPESTRSSTSALEAGPCWADGICYCSYEECGGGGGGGDDSGGGYDPCAGTVSYCASGGGYGFVGCSASCQCVPGDWTTAVCEAAVFATVPGIGFTCVQEAYCTFGRT